MTGDAGKPVVDLPWAELTVAAVRDMLATLDPDLPCTLKVDGNWQPLSHVYLDTVTYQAGPGGKIVHERDEVIFE